MDSDSEKNYVDGISSMLTKSDVHTPVIIDKRNVNKNLFRGNCNIIVKRSKDVADKELWRENDSLVK